MSEHVAYQRLLAILAGVRLSAAPGHLQLGGAAAPRVELVPARRRADGSLEPVRRSPADEVAQLTAAWELASLYGIETPYGEPPGWWARAEEHRRSEVARP